MSPIAIIYTVTAILSIVIAILLVQVTRLQGLARIKAEERKRRQETYGSILTDEPLRKVILDEVGDVIASPDNAQKVSDRVSTIFTKELEKRVDLYTQELDKKYETVIQEKSQNEEIAWKKYKRVLSEKRETEAVIRSIAEGLVVVDTKGKVVMMNPAAEKLLGVNQKDKLGKPIKDDLGEEHLVSLSKGAPEDENREIELVSQYDETKRVVRASSAVIENESGQAIGMVSVLSDITKQKELDRMKSNFIASVSHELRTPLVAIEKSILLILNKETGPISKTQEQFLFIADRNLKRLTHLINDLLDMSKIEAGKMELKPEPSSIEKVVGDAVDGVCSWANAKSIKIEKKIQQEMPAVNIDPNRIIQVLTNLIGNAIKFTPNGGTVTVEAVFRQDMGAAVVGVEDTGIGILPEDLPRLFSKFFQVGERITTDVSGTGLGLAISKEIVELHGGKIWAESEKGRGAKFTFTLPVGDIQQTEAEHGEWKNN